jgi:hypothetical protein
MIVLKYYADINILRSFVYVERKIDDLTREKQDILYEYLLADYPSAIQKKITLLSHFKEHLNQNKVLNES